LCLKYKGAIYDTEDTVYLLPLQGDGNDHASVSPRESIISLDGDLKIPINLAKMQ